MQNIYFTNLVIIYKSLWTQTKKIKHTQKIKNSVGLQKIEETNNF